jgi:hypothetical protein
VRQWRRSQEQNELVAGETDRRRAQYRAQVSVCVCVCYGQEIALSLRIIC